MKLWVAALPPELHEEALLALLPEEERQRLLRIRHPGRRQESLAAWALLCRGLGWDRLPAVARTDRGKPWFPDHPTLHFSFSHTEGAVLVGVSARPIGVDIERLRPVGDRLLRQLDCRGPEDFFPLWVRREARAKRSGVGIGAMLRQEPPLAAGECIHLLETFPGYAACVACGEEEAPAVKRIEL